jgi:2-oxoglutarate dehydrogenase E2 component (dihydrolipoamide succinyltransferase)
MEHVIETRNKYKEAFLTKYGIKLGFMSYFVKACCNALEEFPAVNAFIDGTDIVYNNYYDIGVAVSTERGLLVPVIRNADKKGFAEIEQNITELLAKRGTRKLHSMNSLEAPSVLPTVVYLDRCCRPPYPIFHNLLSLECIL